jgi:KaiC/GvpD/RAD55 family RecA-like ATPase
MLSTDEMDSLIQGIDTTDHVLLFYDTQESKLRILYSYLAEGLKQGKGIMYIRTEETPQDVYTGLASHGIDVEPNLASGSILTPSYDEFYIVDGKAETLKILNRWHETSSYFQSKGLGLRATGEVSCFFKENKVRELLRYEYALHKVLYIPMDAICAYNLKTIVETGYTDIIMPLVRAHGKAVFTAEGGTMVLEPENVEDTDIERLLEIKI